MQLQEVPQVDLCNALGEPLYYVGLGLFRQHNLLKKFKIDPFKLKSFLLCVENGYKKYYAFYCTSN